MAAESRSLARVCYRAAFGVARRLVVTAHRAPDPQPESDPVQALGPSAAPVAPHPACGELGRTTCGEPSRTNREVSDGD